MTPESTIDEKLSSLRSDVDRLQGIIAPLLKKVLLDALGDDMSAMAFCFINKQMEHIKSICILVDNHQYRDAWMISRIMFEGLVLLHWANQDPSRPYYWRSYWWVGQFRQLYGKPEYLVHKAEIERNLKTHCAQFLIKRSRNKVMSEITPEDYYKQWYIASKKSGQEPEPIRIQEIIDSVDFTPLYYPTYTLTSGWVHWDSYIVSQALGTGCGCIDYANETKWLGILAYGNGHHSLLLSAAIFDGLFNLNSYDLHDELQSDLKKYDVE